MIQKKPPHTLTKTEIKHLANQLEDETYMQSAIERLASILSKQLLYTRIKNDDTKKETKK